jgi:hypothetical protein
MVGEISFTDSRGGKILTASGVRFRFEWCDCTGGLTPRTCGRSTSVNFDLHPDGRRVAVNVRRIDRAAMPASSGLSDRVGRSKAAAAMEDGR